MEEKKSASTEIRNYWDTRAKSKSNSRQATTNDIYLRELELATLVETLQDLNLPPASRALDVGCGDGYTTARVAQSLPNIHFLGLDYSEAMIDAARKQIEEFPEIAGRVEFRVGDATELSRACGGATFDVVTTDRCLINLDSLDTQARAIQQIAQHLKPNGYYVAIENFIEGHDNMNTIRRAVGLPDIPVRWHNLFFKESEFLTIARPLFSEITFKDFSSSYYFATRVIYSAMCRMRGEEPDYEHEIHQLAVNLPWMGQMSPIRMVVMKK